MPCYSVPVNFYRNICMTWPRERDTQNSWSSENMITTKLWLYRICQLEYTMLIQAHLHARLVHWDAVENLVFANEQVLQRSQEVPRKEWPWLVPVTQNGMSALQCLPSNNSIARSPRAAREVSAWTQGGPERCPMRHSIIKLQKSDLKWANARTNESWILERVIVTIYQTASLIPFSKSTTIFFKVVSRIFSWRTIKFQMVAKRCLPLQRSLSLSRSN